MGKTESAVIDLETLGTTPYSLILEVGAATVSEIPNVFSKVIKLEESIAKGFKVEAETLKWWLSEKEGRINTLANIINDPDAVSIQTALNHLIGWLLSHNVKYVWGNGAAFDIVLLECYYHKERIPIPWHYGDVRDIRTAESFGHPKFMSQKRTHRAWADAREEAFHLWKCLAANSRT